MGHDDNKGVVNEVVEWRIKVKEEEEENDTLLERSLAWLACIWAVIAGLVFKVSKFVKKAWEIGLNDPRKFIHGLKVGVALSAVLVFYYMKPLYDGVGGNSMWAIMTVVVVLEHTAGATIYKTVNRICGTSLAGFLAMGVHWLASRAGGQFEPIIVGFSLFLLASAATFSRFIPSIKARFDYGAMIFILTFSLVSVSGYRVDKLLDMAQQRLSTIIIGTSLCIIVSMTICPIWAGQELHVLVTKNLEKLATSLQGCVDQYFSSSETLAAISDEDFKKKLLGYKCVLSSKASEESMANLARWEPAHGRFSFRHPWKQYLKIGASMRNFASCLDALIGCINSENKTPYHIKKNMSSISLKLGTTSASVIRELATTLKNMTKSTKVDILVVEMNNAAQELKDLLNSYPNFVINNSPSQNNNEQAGTTQSSSSPSPCQELAPRAIEIPLLEIVQVVTVASLIIEIVTRVEDIVKVVEELSDLAEFQETMSAKSKHDEGINKTLMV